MINILTSTPHTPFVAFSPFMIIVCFRMLLFDMSHGCEFITFQILTVLNPNMFCSVFNVQLQFCSFKFRKMFQYANNSKSKKSIKNTCYFRGSSKRFCPKHFQSERFPQKGSPLLLAISLFISPIFGRSLSDCHFRRPLAFRSPLLLHSSCP